MQLTGYNRPCYYSDILPISIFASMYKKKITWHNRLTISMKKSYLKLLLLQFQTKCYVCVDDQLPEESHKM